MGMKTGEDDNLHFYWVSFSFHLFVSQSSQGKRSQEVKGIHTRKQLSEISFVVMEVHRTVWQSQQPAPGEEIASSAESRQPIFYIILKVERAPRSHINA